VTSNRVFQHNRPIPACEVEADKQSLTKLAGLLDPLVANPTLYAGGAGAHGAVRTGIVPGMISRSPVFAALLVGAMLAFVPQAHAESRIETLSPTAEGWRVWLDGVESPRFLFDGAPAAASRGAAPGEWLVPAPAAAQPRRLVVNDGRRDLLAVRLVPDDASTGAFNDWTIYHLMLADFANGDASNDRAGLRRWVHSTYSGGDLQGVLARVDYLKALGVNAVWLSPLWASETSHGYDVMNYYRIGDAVSVPRDPQAALQLYRRTVDALHAAGIRVILDLPLNHASGAYERRDGDPKGLKPRVTTAQQEAEKTWDSWNAGFRYWNFADPRTREFLIEVGRHWLTEGQADGFRLDYVRGVPSDFLSEFHSAMKAARPGAFLFGEAWQDAAAAGPNAEDIARYYVPVPGKGPQFDGLLDFPLQITMTEVFARGRGSARDLEHWLQRTEALYAPGARPVHFLDNHDLARFLDWTDASGKDRLVAALGFMAALSSPMVIYYGSETGLRGGRAEAGFNDTGRLPMPWNSLDEALTERVRKLLAVRTQTPALTHGARWPLHTDDSVLVMRKSHPSGDVLVAVNLAAAERTVSLPAGLLPGRDREWSPVFGDTAPLAGADGAVSWALPPHSTSIAR